LINPHTVHIVSSYSLHNCPLSSAANVGIVESERKHYKGEEAMTVKGMLEAGVVALVSGMRSLFIVAGRSESRTTGEEGNSAGLCHHENSAGRAVLREELIVFAAVASAYLLAWAASQVFQQ
jgi:hypothetical protein